ncbi:MAG: homoserine dehydrogenase, partial [Pseudomonadota bacterium]|nr:homoserine dehydrogenase [Pseudomonadota bacterium]
EADPSVDVDGIDAAHKLALLASVAFGAEVNFHAVHVEGIQFISADDIAFASELGYRIKLLGIANQTELGVEQRVHPAMVPIDSPLAHVEGVFNAVVVEADAIGTSVLQGKGAGAKPTASAVVSDLIDIARNTVLPTFSVPLSELSQPKTVSLDNRQGPYYLRLMVLDRPGVIADVSAALKEEGVSVEVLLQRGRSEEGSVPVVLKLHETVEANVRRAVEQIAQLDSVVERPCMIRIEEL